VAWAIEEICRSLAARGAGTEVRDGLGETDEASARVVVVGPDSAAGRAVLDAAGVLLPAAPETLALVPGTVEGKHVVVATGRDVRGLVYAVLELADRVGYGDDPIAALRLDGPVVERPANRVRGVMRLFASDVEDLGWFRDQETEQEQGQGGSGGRSGFWTRYLTTLAAQRFNRFNLALGLGYDFPRGVRDAYFYFAYPFLLSVPGYDVRVRELPEAERERNLEALRLIANETVARGLHFQIGLWTHAYQMQDSPDVNYTVEGLTAETHAAYCRDALRTLLQQVPAIGGVTLRIHGESGVPEQSYAFWHTVFQGAAECGRRVDLDLHSKGIDQQMIDLALETGLPVTVSPKYWAEHLGLPYHQAEIRPTEQTQRPGAWEQSHMALSAGSRRFTRYGYADLLREDRRNGVVWRVWPGTQRLLLWGDPVFAAGYGRAAHFAGSDGMEWFDPLSFKGRKGSGLAGHRTGYADSALLPGADWEKFAYTYRLLGRLLYNPDAEPETWRRFLHADLGDAAGAAEQALAHASRILPLVTAAHLPSAANYGWWAEMPANVPIVDERRRHPYGDTPSPKRFGTVSPLDPQLFSRVDDYADELVTGEPTGKYSPLEVAQWLAGFARSAEAHLEQAEVQTEGQHQRASAPFRRLAADVRIQAGLGRFYAEKLRSAVAWAVYVRTGDVAALREAVERYRLARAGWVAAAQAAAGVYVDDLTFGPVPHLRGTWSDRLPGIDEDLADMAAELVLAEAGTSALAAVPAAGDAAAVARWAAALQDPAAARHAGTRVDHAVPASFTRGSALEIGLTVHAAAAASGDPPAVQLRYRHFNQAEHWQDAGAHVTGGAPGAAGAAAHYRAEIPAAYTDSPYPLQYFFVLRDSAGAWLHPGFAPDLANQPYFVVLAQT
jgi:hypothetical protein